MIKPYPEVKGRIHASRWMWERRKDWPQDWMDKVFLGRAIDAVGEYLFDEAWSGTDPEGDPRIAALPARFSDGLPFDQKTVGESGWQEAVAGREEHHRLAMESHRRWWRATKLIGEALRSGAIRAHGRQKKGTRFIPIPHESWNIDDLSPVYRSLDLPVRTGWMDGDVCWVFIERDGLEALLLCPPSAHMSQIEG